MGGAQADHVFWQVGSSATLGTGTDFAGSILALESITLNTGATVDGRVLALNGAVTLDNNTLDNSPLDSSTVPEPSTFAFMGTTILALATTFHRKVRVTLSKLLSSRKS